MRIAHLIVVGMLAASAALAAPAQARNSDAQKGEDKATSSSSCSAYQQSPDGSWEQLPCKETGERGQPQTQHKSGTQGADQGER
jgi:type II secretory pathway pseudopilin PulG